MIKINYYNLIYLSSAFFSLFFIWQIDNIESCITTAGYQVLVCDLNIAFIFGFINLMIWVLFTIYFTFTEFILENIKDEIVERIK